MAEGFSPPVTKTLGQYLSKEAALLAASLLKAKLPLPAIFQILNEEGLAVDVINSEQVAELPKLKLRKRKFDHQALLPKILELRAIGISVPSIAKQLGCSHTTIYKIAPDLPKPANLIVNSKYSPETRAEAVALVRSGLSFQKTAAKVKMSTSQVRNVWLKAQNVGLHK